jgi:hypothetical protein
MLPEDKRLYIRFATVLFLVIAGAIWYLDLARLGDIKQVENTVRAEYKAWFDNIQANYSCNKISDGCVIGGAFYKTCPSIQTGVSTFAPSFTNKSS